ncbi:MAG: hypothetical protein JNJ94_14990 [Chlorobi bacterium]|nr:hypothetical protein [Chlorobiota bacterium]
MAKNRNGREAISASRPLLFRGIASIIFPLFVHRSPLISYRSLSRSCRSLKSPRFAETDA